MKKITRMMISISTLLIVTACVTQGQKQEPSAASRKEAAQLNTSLGVQYMQQGQFDMAMEKLQRALKLDPDLPDTHNALALLYTRLGESRSARDEYKTSLRLDPDNSATMNNYGTFLCAEGEYKEAIKYFEKAVKNPLYQTPEAAYTNAGRCARDQGKIEEAEAFFRRALAADPKFRNALLEMADLSFDNQVYLQARAFIDRYMQYTPKPPPDALWLGLRIEQELQNPTAARNYGDRLIEQFPESVQTRWVLEMGQDAG